MVLRRGTVVIAHPFHVVRWNDTDAFMSVMRILARQRLAAARRRAIWHKTPVGRAVFLPAGWNL